MIQTDYLSVEATEHAIKLVKDTFQQQLSAALRLRRVTAPLFVESGRGLNDDLSGTEQPVSFFVPALGKHCEIVHSLAKWKRMKLWRLKQEAGFGIYTDMNAIRTFETPDDIHSLYVDQWDWERVIRPEDRNDEFLHQIVSTIYSVLLSTEYVVCERTETLRPFLPHSIYFITSEELLERYPSLTAKERETQICREHGAVFVQNIGGELSDGTIHDSRAADYDDWTLNGDILIWYPYLEKAVELSSMGIRVDAEALTRQLAVAGHADWANREYHKLLLENRLPLTIGGGIGQSRLCMLLLHKRHIGEVQVGIWADDDIARMQQQGINILR